MIEVTAPDWLRRHGGGLQVANDGSTHFVLINDRSLYRLTPVPASGKFGCVIVQTNNGQRLPADGTYDSKQSAIQGGLEELGKYLGWR